jgi:allantoinase
VVLPYGMRPASIQIHNGVIAGVGPYEATPAEDYGDLVIMPGLVDTHVHINEPGRAEWEGFTTATCAAAAGGVTTLIEMPLNSVPATVTVEALETKAAVAQGQCWVDVGFWGGVIPGNAGEVRPLWEAGCFGFKCFLAPSGVDEFPHITEVDLRPAMREIATCGGVLLAHAEDPAYLGFTGTAGRVDRFAREAPSHSTPGELAPSDATLGEEAPLGIWRVTVGGGATVDTLLRETKNLLPTSKQIVRRPPLRPPQNDEPTGFSANQYANYLHSRPRRAEDSAIELLIRLSAETGCRVHIVHLSSSDSLAQLAAARAGGLALTVETCPHYLAFQAEEIPDGATEFKCAPPIRESANRDALWRALRGGGIDFVVSDHSPCPPAMKCKETGNFFSAWGGIASLELGLSAVWTEARQRSVTIEDIARWLSDGPAKLAGLGERKGAIAHGYDADLVVWDPEAAFTVDPTRLSQRHKLTPYAGRRLLGVVRKTLLRGQEVDPESPARGRIMRRNDTECA